MTMDFRNSDGKQFTRWAGVRSRQQHSRAKQAALAHVQQGSHSPDGLSKDCGRTIADVVLPIGCHHSLWLNHVIDQHLPHQCHHQFAHRLAVFWGPSLESPSLRGLL